MEDNAPQPPQAEKIFKATPPLRGIIRCGHCNCAMALPTSVKRHKRYRYYRCTRTALQNEGECPIKQVNAAKIEDLVIQEMARVLPSAEIVVAVSRLTAIEPKRVLDMFGEKFWKELSLPERTRLIELMVESVTVCDDGVEIVIRAAEVKSMIEEAVNKCETEG